MLNSLLLIIVIVSSLFLAFYCVDTHKDNIVTLMNMDEKSMELVSVKVEENLTKEEVKVIEPVKKVYVEVLAMEDINETNQIVEEVEPKETIDDKVTSKYSEESKLDDLEKMIMEELKKGNKD